MTLQWQPSFFIFFLFGQLRPSTLCVLRTPNLSCMSILCSITTIIPDGDTHLECRSIIHGPQQRYLLINHFCSFSSLNWNSLFPKKVQTPGPANISIIFKTLSNAYTQLKVTVTLPQPVTYRYRWSSRL